MPPTARDAQGEPVRGAWEHVLTEATFTALLAAMERPEAPSRIPRKGARHYLLTGLVRCGVCNGVMYGSPAQGGRYYYYRCADNGHHNSASGTAIDAIAREITVRHLASVDLDRPRPAFDGEARLAEVIEQIGELMAAVASAALSGAVAFEASR